MNRVMRFKHSFLSIAVCAACCGTLLAADGTSPRAALPGITLFNAPCLSLAGARQIADAAMAEADRLGAGGAIAVVDSGGHLLVLLRRDGTFPAAPEVATAKARTAAIFRKNTQEFENAIKNGRNSLVAVDAMTPLEGGVQIVVHGQSVGAVGVSGAHSSTEDVQIATAGSIALSTP